MLLFHDWVWLLWALWVLVLPLNWVLGALAAAAFHELCHMAAVRILGGEIRQISVAPFGAVIRAEGISGWREVIAVLAGPGGSLLLLCLIRRYSTVSLCGLVQGWFNLLPVRPLDGGRALYLLLKRIMPDRAEVMCSRIEGGTVAGILLGVGVLSYRYSLGFALACFCILSVFWLRKRKRP